MVVAVVTSHLANSMKQQTEIARKREKEMGDLYAFSRRLAAAPSAADIYRAIEEHLANLVQRKVVLFGAGGRQALPVRGNRARPNACTPPSPTFRTGRIPATTVDDGAGRHLAHPPRLAGERRLRRDRHRPRQRAGRQHRGDAPARRRGAGGCRRHARAARRRARARRSQDALRDRAPARGADRLGLARVAHAAGLDPRRRHGAGQVAGGRPRTSGSPRSPASCATRRSASTTISRTSSMRPASAAQQVKPRQGMDRAAGHRQLRARAPPRGGSPATASTLDMDCESAVHLCRCRAGRAGIRADRRQRGQIFAGRLADHGGGQTQRQSRRAVGARSRRRPDRGGERATRRAVLPRPAARWRRPRAPASDCGSPRRSCGANGGRIEAASAGADQGTTVAIHLAVCRADAAQPEVGPDD